MALYLSYEDTKKLNIDMADLIGVFEEAYKMIGSESGVYQSRIRLVYPPISDQGSGRPWIQNMRILPAILPGMGAGLRIGATKARELARGGYLLILFDFETMELKAIISDFLIHGVRSAVPDGVAAKHLSLKTSSTLGVIGSGRIARWATQAVCAVRPIRRIKVYSPNPDHRRDYVRSIKQQLQAEVLDFESPAPVVKDSDIVVTATTARGPVMKGEWLAPGSTVISNTPEELDRVTAKKAKIVVGLKDEVKMHVPPWQAVADLISCGELSEADLSIEMADVLLGRKLGRASEDEIIAFLNPGCGIYDVAIASYVYRRAQEQGLGISLPP